jgi:hypothetical protein
LSANDPVFKVTVGNIVAYLATKISDKFDIPIDRAIVFSLRSHTYKLLNNPNTGLYWDSLSESLDRLEAEYRQVA